MSANLYTLADKNIRKTWLLMTFFLIGVIGIGWLFSYLYENPVILIVAVVFALVMNIVSYWFSDKIVLSMHRARLITREENFELWNLVENLSIAAGLPMPRVFIIEDQAPNAFATGRNKEHAVIGVTTGLLRVLNKGELEGVLAHELSHIGNRDILVSTVAVVLAGFIAILSDIFLRSTLYGGKDRNNRLSGVLMLVGVALAILAPIAATLIRLAVSRKREFLADASGALLTRYPEGLASALRKIHAAAVPMRTAHTATAHLFIANPFGQGGRLAGIKKMFMTHPPVEERIKALIGGR